LHEFKGYEILPVLRQPSGSPATGLLKFHQISQEEIIGKVFKQCICEMKRPYCGLQCIDGSRRRKFLTIQIVLGRKVRGGRGLLLSVVGCGCLKAGYSGWLSVVVVVIVVLLWLPACRQAGLVVGFLVCGCLTAGYGGCRWL